jgi:hypothetical protein
MMHSLYSLPLYQSSTSVEIAFDISRNHCASGPISPAKVSDLQNVPLALRFGLSIALRRLRRM